MRSASSTNTGLQEFCSPWAMVSAPWARPQQRMVSPSTVTFAEQWKLSPGVVTPQSSAAADVRILKVEPGSYTSEMAVMRIISVRAATSFRGGSLGS